MSRNTAIYTCAHPDCRRHIAVPFLQLPSDAMDRAVDKGWSFRFAGRDPAGNVMMNAYCPTHPFFRFWLLSPADRSAA